MRACKHIIPMGELNCMKCGKHHSHMRGELVTITARASDIYAYGAKKIMEDATTRKDVENCGNAAHTSSAAGLTNVLHLSQPGAMAEYGTAPGIEDVLELRGHQGKAYLYGKSKTIKRELAYDPQDYVGEKL